MGAGPWVPSLLPAGLWLGFAVPGFCGRGPSLTEVSTALLLLALRQGHAVLGAQHWCGFTLDTSVGRPFIKHP